MSKRAVLILGRNYSDEENVNLGLSQGLFLGHSRLVEGEEDEDKNTVTIDWQIQNTVESCDCYVCRLLRTSTMPEGISKFPPDYV